MIKDKWSSYRSDFIKRGRSRSKVGNKWTIYVEEKGGNTGRAEEGAVHNIRDIPVVE
jgi:hypothetical protein